MKANSQVRTRKPQKAVITITDNAERNGITLSIVFSPSAKAQEPVTSPAIKAAIGCIKYITKLAKGESA